LKKSEPLSMRGLNANFVDRRRTAAALEPGDVQVGRVSQVDANFHLDAAGSRIARDGFELDLDFRPDGLTGHICDL
jgi:hypothetical protein